MLVWLVYLLLADVTKSFTSDIIQTKQILTCVIAPKSWITLVAVGDVSTTKLMSECEAWTWLWTCTMWTITTCWTLMCDRIT